MTRYRERQNKGYEVQWYDEYGNYSWVIACDNVGELAQHLARSCWGEMKFQNNPTVYYDWKPWCRYETSEVM